MADLPDRRAIKAALRDAGLSNRQVKALLGSGWRGLVSETEAETQELRERIEELDGILRGNGA